ncbi:MAG TPA: hypothetical protein DD381_13660 [Lentisphaeria bacterium]|nr:MAG: hypothetical protein A2X47_03815 [Lentisphaerae bacterium GWF2_38_69]HBM17368.1 hypothetical protein [Lentisphaeria bacterium]
MTELFKSELEKRVFISLQKGIELSSRPLCKISSELQVSEPEIISFYNSFLERGMVRRFGAIFEPAKIGYRSILCASKIEEEQFSKLAEKLLNIKEITHCYTRDYEYNVWFTFTCRQELFKKSLDEIRNIIGYPILEFPSVRKFKTEVIFKLGISAPPAESFKNPISGQIVFDDNDISLAKKLYNISLLPNILETFSEDVLARLKYWRDRAVLKRVALVPYHRNIGYKANAMCVWNVEKQRTEIVGRELSKKASITHCYERVPISGKFPYNLFAMIHAGSHSELTDEFRKLQIEFNLENGRMLETVSELKKTSFYP